MRQSLARKPLFMEEVSPMLYVTRKAYAPRVGCMSLAPLDVLRARLPPQGSKPRSLYLYIHVSQRRPSFALHYSLP